MIHGGWEAPSNHSSAGDLGITPDPRKSLPDKNPDKIPPVLSGMDKAEALAYVSRLFDAAMAGVPLWGDDLLLKRFLEQCSRTGSQETINGYARELRHFVRWRDELHPHLHLRELDPALVDDWVSSLREMVSADELKPRSFNRRISAVSAMYAGLLTPPVLRSPECRVIPSPREFNSTFRNWRSHCQKRISPQCWAGSAKPRLRVPKQQPGISFWCVGATCLVAGSPSWLA